MNKKGLIAILFSIFIFGSHAYSAGTQNPSMSYYTQLIGFKGGGEFFVNSFLSDWSGGVFFENVINPLLGVEIELTKSAVPITNYSYSGLTLTGSGERNYLEMAGGLKIYVYNVSFNFGLTYNSFLSGYIVSTGAGQVYTQMSDKEVNYVGVYLGPELTAQISTDLFTKVGVKVMYGFVTANPNYTFGARFYIAFAYGM